MDSRCFCAFVLLGTLVLVGYVAETNCRALSKNTREDIEKLKETLHQKSLTEKPTGSFFKEQMQNMEASFKKDDQKLLVVEMLSVYSRIFKQMNRVADHRKAMLLQRLHNNTETLTMQTDLLHSSQLLDKIHTIRDYKWSPEEQLKALDEYETVYQKAFDLSK